MKKPLLILTLFLFAIASQAQENTPYFSKSFGATSVENLKIQTSGGLITVLGGENSKAVVDVYIKANNWNKDISKEEIEDRLKDYTLEVVLNGNTLSCIAKPKSNISSWKNGLSISFKVYVPSQISSNLSTSGGSINLTNLEGDLKFSTSGGSLNLEDLKGEVFGSTSGGSIQAMNCDRNVKLSTSGGSIKASQCDGDIDLSTSGGSIKLEKMNGKVTAKTSGGSIKAAYISGELVAITSGGGINLEHLSGNVDARTSGGGIDASIDNPKDYVKLSTSAGSISIDLPENKGYDLDLSGDKVSYSNASNFNGTKSKSKMRGSVNNGGTAISARSSAGNISIN